MNDTKKRLTREELLALPIERQRVEIALDVLALMAANKLEATQGCYMSSSLPWSTLLDDEEGNSTLFRDFFNAHAVSGDESGDEYPSCEVCAIGAIFLATVDKFDSLECHELGYTDPTDTKMVPYLEPWFDTYQLRLIETAFEGKWCGGDVEIYDDDEAEVKRAEFFSHDAKRGWLNAEARMMKIMDNVIENEGVFVP